MNRIDKLLDKAKPKPTIYERLIKDNPYLGKTQEELLNYLSKNNYQAPAMHTKDWCKFVCALMHARDSIKK